MFRNTQRHMLHHSTSVVLTANCKRGHGRRLRSHRRIRRQSSWVSCEFMYTPPTPTRRNSTVSSSRRRRCVLGFTAVAVVCNGVFCLTTFCCVPDKLYSRSSPEIVWKRVFGPTIFFEEGPLVYDRIFESWSHSNMWQSLVTIRDRPSESSDLGKAVKKEKQKWSKRLQQSLMAGSTSRAAGRL